VCAAVTHIILLSAVVFHVVNEGIKHAFFTVEFLQSVLHRLLSACRSEYFVCVLVWNNIFKNILICLSYLNHLFIYI